MTLGPVQLLIVGFDEGDFQGQILAELDRLRALEVVRLVDAVLVHRTEDGSFDVVEIEDDPLSGLPGDGRHVLALAGLDAPGALAGAREEPGDQRDVWYPADAIPPGATVALAAIEHVWATGLREAVGEAGGSLLAEAWVHPSDLMAAGLN